jgi:hypothetical protein
MAIALAAALVVAGGIVFWHASRQPAKASANDKQQHLNERLRKGVGSEVRFASASSRPEQVDETVGSAADFIYRRSGLRMSDETRKSLAKAESDVLKGKANRITLAQLTDGLMSATADKLATLTDEEIEQAADASADENGEIRSRADGRLGVLTRKDLIQQVKSGREWSRRGDSALSAALRPMIEEEVNHHAAALGAALPEQFEQARTQGVTPMQALLIAYSVATDDPLTDSREEITQMTIQKRMDARLTREQKKAQKHVSGQPYGAYGSVHPSAAALFFKPVMDKLLSRAEGGKK